MTSGSGSDGSNRTFIIIIVFICFEVKPADQKLSIFSLLFVH